MAGPGPLFSGSPLRKLAVGAAAILAVVVILQNTQVVAVKFLFWEFRMSRILMIPITLLLGVGIGLLLSPMLRKGQR